jgi:hypothetical protein
MPRYLSELSRSALSDAIQVISSSNARRAELEIELDEAASQLREAKSASKNVNSGRLFQLELENADLERELDHHKVALNEARQLVMSSAERNYVEIPLQLESLRQDLITANTALQAAEASRDVAVKELDRLRFTHESSKSATDTQQRRLFEDSIYLRAKLAGLPQLMRSNTSQQPSDDTASSSHFSDIFKSTDRPRSAVSPASTSAVPPSQAPASCDNYPVQMQKALVPPHTPAPLPLAGIGMRLNLDHSGNLTVKESALLLSARRV